MDLIVSAQYTLQLYIMLVGRLTRQPDNCRPLVDVLTPDKDFPKFATFLTVWSVQSCAISVVAQFLPGEPVHLCTRWKFSVAELTVLTLSNKIPNN